jgi:hypothetical protein
METKDIVYYVALTMFIAITIFNIRSYYREKFDEDWKRKDMKEEDKNS